VKLIVRRYVDLHLLPSTPVNAEEMMSIATELGYRQVALTMPTMSVNDRIRCARRTDISATRSRELIEALNRVRKNYDVVAVKCLTKEVARQAAKDNRVDILLFPDDPVQRKHNWLDSHESELAKDTGQVYEVNVSNLIAARSSHLSKIINYIKKELAVALRRDIPIILSSGATTPIMMREPKAIIALASLLDIDEDFAADMISIIPEAILNRNQAKLAEDVS
jgi:ribonuclease P/MRP protein subunit RPP1